MQSPSSLISVVRSTLKQPLTPAAVQFSSITGCFSFEKYCFLTGEPSGILSGEESSRLAVILRVKTILGDEGIMYVGCAGVWHAVSYKWLFEQWVLGFFLPIKVLFGLFVFLSMHLLWKCLFLILCTFNKASLN